MLPLFGSVTFSRDDMCAVVALGAGIDLSSLIVVEGKLCWDLYIEGLVLSSEGNLLDALGAAIKVYFHCWFLSTLLFSIIC